MADDRDYASEMTLLNTYDPIVELTPEQQAQVTADYQRLAEENIRNAPNIDWSVAQRYYTEGRSDPLGNAFGVLLAVASFAVPGIGQIIGGSILSSAGITGASAALTAGVGAAALSAASTAVQGGSVEDVLKSAASAGVASGLNVGMGGGVSGAVTGSAAGTLIMGGDASQIATNAFAAGVGAGVQGAMTENPDAGKIVGTAARTYIATGGNMDQTLLNTAVSAIGTLDQPTTYAKTTTAQPAPGSSPFQYGNDTYQELDDGTAKVTTQSGNVRILSADTFNEIKQDYATDVAAGASPPSVGAVIPPQTVAEVAPVVSPVVTDLDLVKQVAAQPTPTVDPKELERVIVQGQGANVANAAPVVAPTVTGTDLINQVAEQPAPTAELPPVTVTAKREEETAPTVTELPPVTVTGQQEPTYQLDPVTITGRREEEVAPTVTELPPVTITAPREPVYELPPVTITGQREPTYELDPVTIYAKRDEEIAPTVTELDPVTVTAKREEETVSPLPAAPEVKAEEPKKEEPKKETKTLYPTVTSVPPAKKPGRQPIITGVSPARLLADALSAYRPAGSVEGGESGKERQNVWNEKSLRLKDALGL
jgi:hypothetical protein